MNYSKPDVDFVTEYKADGTFYRKRLDRLTDGRIMCCLCFEFFTRAQLDPVKDDPDGAVRDVCVGCAEHEKAAPRRRTLRVLVTGSRSWTATQYILNALNQIHEVAREQGRLMILVHGDCPSGADNIAKVWAIYQQEKSNENLTARTVREDRHPAAWHTGRGAGMRRNADMVEAGADICLAFICDNSRGATHCAGLAEKAGIPTLYWRTERSGPASTPDAKWINSVRL